LRYNFVNCFLQLFGNRISEDDQFGVGIPIYLIKILEKFISGTPVPFRLINGIKRTMAYVKLRTLFNFAAEGEKFWIERYPN
jgi:hypothetical protein